MSKDLEEVIEVIQDRLIADKDITMRVMRTELVASELLTPGQREWVEKLYAYKDSGKELSGKQIEVLVRIWAAVVVKGYQARQATQTQQAPTKIKSVDLNSSDQSWDDQFALCEASNHWYYC
jgi:hypothetical protein